MKNTVATLNQVETNRVGGGIFCHAVAKVKDPNYFNVNAIKILTKPSNGQCTVLPGITAGSLDIHAGTDSLVCDCKDEYQEDSLVILDLDGNSFKNEL